MMKQMKNRHPLHVFASFFNNMRRWADKTCIFQNVCFYPVLLLFSFVSFVVRKATLVLSERNPAVRRTFAETRFGFCSQSVVTNRGISSIFLQFLCVLSVLRGEDNSSGWIFHPLDHPYRLFLNNDAGSSGIAEKVTKFFRANSVRKMKFSPCFGADFFRFS